MSKFKIGETVIAKGSNSPHYAAGDHIVVDGFTCCPSCGEPCIYLRGNHFIGEGTCKCGHIQPNVRAHFWQSNFEKPISLAETTEYKLRVSIPELIEIKKLQNQ